VRADLDYGRAKFLDITGDITTARKDGRPGGMVSAHSKRGKKGRPRGLPSFVTSQDSLSSTLRTVVQNGLGVHNMFISWRITGNTNPDKPKQNSIDLKDNSPKAAGVWR